MGQPCSILFSCFSVCIGLTFFTVDNYSTTGYCLQWTVMWISRTPWNIIKFFLSKGRYLLSVSLQGHRDVEVIIDKKCRWPWEIARRNDNRGSKRLLSWYSMGSKCNRKNTRQKMKRWAKEACWYIIAENSSYSHHAKIGKRFCPPVDLQLLLLIILASLNARYTWRRLENISI